MKQCTRCVCDESIKGISFDEEGVCNFCKLHDEYETQYPTGSEGRGKIRDMVSKIKSQRKNNNFYDCVIGISGGCDSSYLLHLAVKEWKLRPVAVHFDNGWNTEIAEENMRKMVDALDVPFYRVAVDLQEMNYIYKSFLVARVPDLEAANDIGLTTVLYEAAARYKVKYILNGHSFRTEGFLPKDMGYMDGKYIQSVCEDMEIKFNTFPNLWLSKWLKYLFMGIRKEQPLYYVDYNKKEVKDFLRDKYGWRWYDGHHLENVMTRFCAKYFRPIRLGFFPEMIEHSALIRSGQMKRSESIFSIGSPKVVMDNGFIWGVADKLGIDFDYLKNYLYHPCEKSHKDYKTYQPYFRLLKPLFGYFCRRGLVPMSFYNKYVIRRKGV